MTILLKTRLVSTIIFFLLIIIDKIKNTLKKLLIVLFIQIVGLNFVFISKIIF